MLTMSQNREMVQEQRQEGKCILIVDDEPVIRDLCARALKDYRILQAADGEEALQVYAHGGVDAVLTDVMMPRMDGIELLKRLKEQEPTLVVLIMTGFADKEIILNALKADADDFITKPLNLLQLKTTVQNALDKKDLKEEIASLRSADRLKSNFLSLISHKFRTPLTAISLFLQNLASGIYDPADPAARENLRLIYNETCYLERLVADLLDFSRLMDTSDGLKLVPCNLTSLVTEVLIRSQQLYGKPGIALVHDLEQLSSWQFDCEKIVFAIKQVVDNAFKFSREPGQVTVTLRNLDGGCQLQVEDKGPGIPREEVPKVFEKFYQIDMGLTGQIRGFGLGLYYAREFVQMHRGSINIESEPGQGTKVSIYLPHATI
jgi:two-component system, sensor histidine kinase and response regulator